VVAPRAFRHGVPALDEFPFGTWSRLAPRRWRRPPWNLVGYGDRAGYRPLREAIADHLGASEGYGRFGIGMIEMGRSEFAGAASCFLTVLPIFEEHSDGHRASMALTLTGTTLLARGDLEGTRRMFEEGLESARRWGNAVGTYVALYNLAQLALARGDLVPAADALEEGVGGKRYYVRGARRSNTPLNRAPEDPSIPLTIPSHAFYRFSKPP
jgi:hypothetical protein